MMTEKYGIIYGDPPWNYDDKAQAGERGADFKYDTLEDEDVYSLPVQEISADDCALLLWVTFPKLIEGLKTIEQWGFKYKTLGFVWVKSNKADWTRLQKVVRTVFGKVMAKIYFSRFWDKLSENKLFALSLFFGMGNWTRSNPEICLIGVKGKTKRNDAKDARNIPSVVFAPLGDRHSEKPSEVRDKIVRLCGDLPRIELFACDKFKGWDAWGNQVKSNVRFPDWEKRMAVKAKEKAVRKEKNREKRLLREKDKSRTARIREDRKNSSKQPVQG